MNITTSTLNIYLTDTDKIGEQIMSAASTILAKIDELKASTTAGLSRVAEDVTFLKTKAEAGETVSAEQLDQILSGLDSVKVALDATDPVPDNPTPGIPDPPPAPPE